jgi:vancomycin aglycone glucosyltransferase
VRVLLSTYDSREGVEPPVGLAVRLRALGAEVRVCAPPDRAERLAEVGVPLVPAGEPERALVHRATPPSPDDVAPLTAELIATWFDKVAATERCSSWPPGLPRRSRRLLRATVASDLRSELMT